MIKRLAIENYAIIEKVEIDFSEHLTIITGETGAGKSIMLGALGLIMGDRAEPKTLKDPHRKCVIEGYFDVLRYDLKAFFEENDIDYDTEVVLRREISPSGKSRAFVNDTPVRLPELKALSLKLLDIHRQFDTLDIQGESFQLQILDALANNKETLATYGALYRDYQAHQRQLEEYRTRSERDAKEMDFLNYQLEELSKAELQADEQAQLEEELARLTNAEGIKQATTQAYQMIAESELSVLGSLRDLSIQVGQMKGFHKELETLHERFEGVILELDDIANEFNDISEDTEYDEARIVELNERLDLIYRLQTKHKVETIAELLDIQARLEDQVTGFGDLSEQIEALEHQIAEERKELLAIADILSERRRGQMAGFEESVHRMLAELSMEHARLQIVLEQQDTLTSTGRDHVQFLFSANKGGRLDLIKQVASGGELSRLALCAKALVAHAIPLPTIIFDEIDAGVSGEVALRMADILKRLSTEHQVVTITHTPQIAAKADLHYFVYKEVLEDSTVSHVKALSREERIQEIAIMLSGNPPSEYAVSNAVDLLDKA